MDNTKMKEKMLDKRGEREEVEEREVDDILVQEEDLPVKRGKLNMGLLGDFVCVCVCLGDFLPAELNLE